MDQVPSLKLELPNDLQAVAGANQSLQEFLERQGVNPDVVFSVTLVMEEIVTNIIKYSYDDNRAHEIQLEVLLQGDRVTLRIADDGHEFNPLSFPAPERDQPPESRTLGGLGIHLVRNMTGEIKYERTNGRNVLTLHFPIDQKN